MHSETLIEYGREVDPETALKIHEDIFEYIKGKYIPAARVITARIPDEDDFNEE